MSMWNGIRNTTGCFMLHACDKCKVLFGGSTVFCEEVPDDLTIASFLQRYCKRMKVHQSESINTVVASGATAIDRVEMLVDASSSSENE